MGFTADLLQGLYQSAAMACRLRKGRTMKTCECCGNTYDKCFEVSMNGETHVFDSFECAIQTLAPTCEHCGCRIVGHGMEDDGKMYCCAHCARESGVKGVADNADRPVALV